MTGADRLISNSEVSDYKRCKRRWWLRHVRRLEPKAATLSGPMALGNRVHEALARYYDPLAEAAGVGRPADVIALWDYETQGLLERLETDGETLIAKAVADDSDMGRAMLEGYFSWLEETGADADWEVLGAEREVYVPFNGGPVDPAGRALVLVGKLDIRILIKSSNARRFVDHKTVANISDLPKIADISEQFLHYGLLDLLEHVQAGTASDAAFVDGGVYNMLRKVKRTVRATPPFYARHEVRHPKEELRSYWIRLAGEVAEMLRTEERLLAGEDHRAVVYPTPTRDCSWDCNFRRVCPMFDHPSEDAEGFLVEAYTTSDPYARYLEKEPAPA